jgi:wobble nucleotide-excising tRNase
MLSRIVRLQHVGLFQNGTPAPLQLRKATLVYGENGRGKSTLAAVLDSCGRGRPELILCRSTIDQAGAAPAVELIFDSGAPNVAFGNGAWSSRRGEIRVFDGAFVHDNVHTGVAVTTENRRGLYEFALGDAARDVYEMDRLAQEHQAAGRLRGERERVVTAHAAPYNLGEFVALQPDNEIDSRLDDARRRLAAHTRAAQVLARQDLAPLSVPRLDVDATFAGLRRNIDDVHADAERQARAHFAKHHEQQGFEDWVSRGNEYERHEECPYCGQSTEGVEVISAYRQYFSRSYALIKNFVTMLRPGVLTQVSPALTDRWSAIIETNQARQEAWTDLVPAEPLTVDIAGVVVELDRLRAELTALFDRKQASPLEVCGTDEEKRRANELLAAISEHFRAYNEGVRTINERYAARKREVATGDAATLAYEVRRLEAVKRRFTQSVADEVELYVTAVNEAAAAAAAKDALREHHDQTMQETLARYEVAINRRLDALRTGFRIVQFAGRHDAGQRPRTTYAIQLRGRTIAELERAGNGHSLPTALSDGDRRSLALAFFLARLDLDRQLATRIVVFDDPMASFDENRKSETVRALQTLVGQCEQLIVLSHDAHFLRELSEALHTDGRACISHRIGYAAEEYAQFEPCDLGELCRLPYFERYLSAARYLAGQNAGQARQIAEDLRVLVEEYYKLRYPHLFGETMTLGNMIAEITRAPAGSALAMMHGLVDHLDRFNEYAGRYHHSNPNHGSEVLREHELRHYVRGALSLIQDDGRSCPIIA